MLSKQNKRMVIALFLSLLMFSSVFGMISYIKVPNNSPLSPFWLEEPEYVTRHEGASFQVFEESVVICIWDDIIHKSSN